MSAAVRRAPSLSVRTLGLALAAAMTAAMVAVLALGFSQQVIHAIRQAPTLVNFIPLSQPEPPPPPPEIAPVQQVKQVELRVTPAPAPRPETSSAPPQPVDATIVPLAPPAPPPSASPGSGSGAPGTGSGGGGTGEGGTGGGGTGTGDAGRVTATPPDWIVKPDLLPYYPAVAKQRGVDGEVLLECRILRTQRLVGCRVLRARPRGYGFDQAALAAIRDHRATPPMFNGRMLEDLPVKIPIRFNNIRTKKK
jgi:protein TonB